MHLGVGRIEEEPEGVLDLPHDLRLGRRHAPVHHGQHEREANAPACIDPHQSAPSSCAARPHPAVSDEPMRRGNPAHARDYAISAGARSTSRPRLS